MKIINPNFVYVEKIVYMINPLTIFESYLTKKDIRYSSQLFAVYLLK